MSDSSDRQWVGYDDLRSVTVKVMIDFHSSVIEGDFSLGSICENIEFGWRDDMDFGSR